ncbi:MAG: hypothetical protein ACTHOR_13305, partial [Devosia sp.]|nr:hypothetical protein [Devosiaceae bacterium]
MRPLYSAISVVGLLVLAGCATNDDSYSYNSGPMLGAMTPSSTDDSMNPDQQVANTPPPAQQVSAGVQNLDIEAFTDPNGYRSLDTDSKAQAASAQYFALQFGRVGAARTWSGSNNLSGSVNVGPYVKVNNHDCRDFTNIVNVGSKSYTKRGTACRADDGHWAVGTADIMSAPGGAPAAPAAASGFGAQG